jgi:cation diffusion facilitator family transporter
MNFRRELVPNANDSRFRAGSGTDSRPSPFGKSRYPAWMTTLNNHPPATSATPRRHYEQAIRATWLGLWINFLLGAIKLVGGIFGHSLALISDAINSLGDSIASIVTIIALRYAQSPADDEHPYGHTRVEAVAGLLIATLISASAFYVAWEAVQHFWELHPLPPGWTLWIAAGNVVVKEALFWYSHRVGKRTGSSAILANAWDHRSDALCSLAVLIGLTLIIAFGTPWIWADEAASIVIAAAIFWSGGKLFLGSISELLDPQAEPETVAEIRRLAEQVDGVRAVEKLRVRKTGIEYLVDIHVQVDAQLTVAVGHAIGHQVRDALVHQMACVRDVLVHLEPYPHQPPPDTLPG